LSVNQVLASDPGVFAPVNHLVGRPQGIQKWNPTTESLRR